MTDEQIKRMAERFLRWRLPPTFNPDNGISIQRPNYAPSVLWEPSGTNLLSYTEAEAMVRFMVGAEHKNECGMSTDFRESLNEVLRGLQVAMVASCACSHVVNICSEPEAHELTCRYRVLYVAADKLADVLAKVRGEHEAP